MKNDVIQEEFFSSIGASPLTHTVYVKLHTSIISKLGVTIFARKKKKNIFYQWIYSRFSFSKPPQCLYNLIDLFHILLLQRKPHLDMTNQNKHVMDLGSLKINFCYCL